MDELQKIYDSEINVSFSWLWDGGIDVKLGDEMNGFVAASVVTSKPAIEGHFKTGQSGAPRGSHEKN
jgi:hypothetical protein